MIWCYPFFLSHVFIYCYCAHFGHMSDWHFQSSLLPTPPTHTLFAHAHTHTHVLTHASSNARKRFCMCLRTHALTHACTYKCTRLCTHALTHALTHARSYAQRRSRLCHKFQGLIHYLYWFKTATLLVSSPEVKAWMVDLLMLLPELLILNSHTYFLVECTQLYYALCLSVHQPISPSEVALNECSKKSSLNFCHYLSVKRKQLRSKATCRR